MIKKSLFLVLISSLSACSTYYEAKNCDPAKNYINSNPEAIEKYKLLSKNGKVKSYYLKMSPAPKCNNINCFSYNPANFDFKEVYINDKTRNGIYTIKIKNTEECLVSYNKIQNDCYIYSENLNNIIKSRFYLEQISTDDTIYRKFTDLEKNIVLFESSIQFYSKPSISGEPNGGFCSVKKNNPDYKFNTLAFP